MLVLRAALLGGRPAEGSASAEASIPINPGEQPYVLLVLKKEIDMLTLVHNTDTSSNLSSNDHLKGGFIPLGTAGRLFAVFSKLDKQVRLLKTSDFNEMQLKADFGAQWCDAVYEEFHEKKEVLFFNHKRMAKDIMSGCQAAGPFNVLNERGLGVWRHGDTLLVNGKELWTPEGEILEHGIVDGMVYPVYGDLGFGPDTPPATDEEVQEVLKAFASLCWKQSIGAELILGFMGVGFLSTAMRRRPHMLLTGPAGCGKSTMLAQIGWLLGNVAYCCSGPQTMAAYYQSLGGKSKVVVQDEFEANPVSKACAATFEVARSSYSVDEGNNGIVKGSPSGPISYRFFSPFIAAGISPGKMEPADLTRWVVLEAMAKPSGLMLTEERARELGPRLAKRFILRWSVFLATESVVRQCILESGGTGRMADTVGTLLASYWAFVSPTAATPEDAQILVDMFNIKERIELHEVSDEKECLESLSSRVMTFKVMGEDAMLNRKLSIGEAIALVCKDPTGQPEVVQRLAQVGLRVSMLKGKWSLIVANSPMHQELRKLFSGTKWAGGGWPVVLRRLPGGEESTQRLGAGMAPTKVTVIDVPAHWLPANDESDMQLAA